jgi:hypothetical protein
VWQELTRQQRSFSARADSEEWLADRHANAISNTSRSADGGGAGAVEEEHVLCCLGADLIMHWNNLPTNLQRELFDHVTPFQGLGLS